MHRRAFLLPGDVMSVRYQGEAEMVGKTWAHGDVVF